MTIGYVTIGHNDLEKSTAFYAAVLAPLGYAQTFKDGGWAGFGPGGKNDGLEIYLATPHDGKPATFGNGSMLALKAADRATVEAVHAAALSAGGVCEGPPGVRGTQDPPFYGAYFRDPAGNKLAAYCRG